MISREHYFEHGLDKLEFDAERSHILSEGELMSDEDREALGVNGAIAPRIAATLGLERRPLPEGTRHTEVTANPDYDHGRDISAVARAIHLEVAPTVTLDDMPNHLPGEVRRSLFSAIASSNIDLEKVSRKALELELTEDAQYWETAFTDCVEPMQREAKRAAAAGEYDADPSRLETINECYGALKDRLESPYNPMGEASISEKLGAALFAAKDGYPVEDAEAITAHFVANSRIGNRYARQFAKATRDLPEEAEPIADQIQSSNSETRVMWRAKQLAEKSGPEFISWSRRIQDQAATAILKDVEGSSPVSRQDVVHAKACSRRVKEVAALDPAGPRSLSEDGMVNRAIMGAFPRGGDTQAVVFINEIARRQVAERERSISAVFTPLGNQER